MKFALFSIAALVLACGCSHNTAGPVTASQPEPLPLPKKCDAAPCDNFDKAGTVFADSTRYVYDESVKGYRYLTSDEMEARYKAWWEAAKKAAAEGVDATQQAIKDHK